MRKQRLEKTRTVHLRLKTVGLYSQVGDRSRGMRDVEVDRLAVGRKEIIHINIDTHVISFMRIFFFRASMTTRQRDSHVSLTRAAILLVHHAKSDLPTTDRRPSSNLRKAKFLIRQFPSPNSTYFCLSPRSREKQFSTTDIDQSSPSQRIVIRNNIA